MNDKDLSEALTTLVLSGLIEVSVDNDGEFVFWMTEEQKERYENMTSQDFEEL